MDIDFKKYPFIVEDYDGFWSACDSLETAAGVAQDRADWDEELAEFVAVFEMKDGVKTKIENWQDYV